MPDNTAVPMLDVHQGVPQPEAKEATPQEEQTIKMVENLFTEAKRGREPYIDRDGLENYRFYRGEHWADPLPDYLSTETVNYVYSDIRTMLALMTDTAPTITPLPWDSLDKADVEWARVLRDWTEYKWSKYGWSSELAYAYLDKMIYRTGYWRIEWDKELNKGLGDVLVQAIDPFMCFPDPYCYDINSPNSRYFIYTEPVTVGELKRQYPEKADKLKADMSMVGNILEERREFAAPEVKATSYEQPMVAAAAGSSGLDSRQALKIHCWLRDTTTEEYKLERKDGSEQTEERMRFPKGRYIVVAGGELCEDRENPYKDGKFPFVRFANNPLPREFHGISEVEVRKSPQRMLNRLVSHWMNHIELTDNPIWIVDSNAAIDVEDITNEFGMIMEKAPGSEVRREGGQPMGAHIFRAYELVLQSLNVVGGVHEAIRGRLETGISSGLMLNSVQEAAQAPVRLQERYSKDALNQAGRLILSRMLQFSNEPIEFSSTDKSTGETSRMQVSVTPPDEQGQQTANFRKLGSQDQIDMISRSVPIKGEPDIKITTGVGMPFAKTVQMDKAITFLKAGMIDREAALKMSDIENWEEILARIKEQEAAELQAAQAAEAQKQGLA